MSQARLGLIFLGSTLTATALYLVVSYSAYSTYGTSVLSDMLKNYPSISLVSTARIFISFVVTFSYPLQINPTRRCILTVLKVWMDDDKPVAASVNRIRYIVITVVFLLASLGIALALEDLGIVVELVGAFGGTLLMFVLPGFLFLYHFPIRGSWINGDCKHAPPAEIDYPGRDDYLQGTGADPGRVLKTEEGLDVGLLTGQAETTDGDGSGSGLPGGIMFVPQIYWWHRPVAWTQLISGLVLGPLCVIVIFL